MWGRYKSGHSFILSQSLFLPPPVKMSSADYSREMAASETEESLRIGGPKAIEDDDVETAGKHATSSNVPEQSKVLPNDTDHDGLTTVLPEVNKTATALEDVIEDTEAVALEDSTEIQKTEYKFLEPEKTNVQEDTESGNNPNVEPMDEEKKENVEIQDASLITMDTVVKSDVNEDVKSGHKQNADQLDGELKEYVEKKEPSLVELSGADANIDNSKDKDVESGLDTNGEQLDAERRRKVLIVFFKALISFLNSKSFVGLVFVMGIIATVIVVRYKDQPTPLVFDKDLLSQLHESLNKY